MILHYLGAALDQACNENHVGTDAGRREAELLRRTRSTAQPLDAALVRELVRAADSRTPPVDVPPNVWHVFEVAFELIAAAYTPAS